jgi:hypothetical protein
MMLEILPAPDPVVAMRASGRLDEGDVERGIEAIEAALARQDRIALYAEIYITGMTPASFARNVTYSLGKLGELHRFRRAAVVTDQEWVRWITEAEHKVFPGIDVGVFPPAEKKAALSWVSESVPQANAEAAPKGPAITIIGTTAPNVVGLEVAGKIGPEDTRRLISAFNEAMKKHEGIRVLVRVLSFAGVTLEALRQEGLVEAKLRGLRKVERYALVGGPTWIEGLTRGFAPLVGIETRHFSAENEPQAWSWVGAEPSS